MSGENDVSNFDLETVEQCKEECLGNVNCQSIDWYEDGEDKRCLLSYTKAEESSDFNADLECQYFEKTCSKGNSYRVRTKKITKSFLRYLSEFWSHSEAENSRMY